VKVRLVKIEAVVWFFSLVFFLPLLLLLLPFAYLSGSMARGWYSLGGRHNSRVCGVFRNCMWWVHKGKLREKPLVFKRL